MTPETPRKEHKHGTTWKVLKNVSGRGVECIHAQRSHASGKTLKATDLRTGNGNSSIAYFQATAAVLLADMFGLGTLTLPADYAR